jgi:hypothetical protein
MHRRRAPSRAVPGLCVARSRLKICDAPCGLNVFSPRLVFSAAARRREERAMNQHIAINEGGKVGAVGFGLHRSRTAGHPATDCVLKDPICCAFQPPAAEPV